MSINRNHTATVTNFLKGNPEMHLNSCSTTETLASLRIPADHLQEVIGETLGRIGDYKLSNRFLIDQVFAMRVADLAHGILLSSTLAQTLGSSIDFKAFCSAGSLAAGELDLVKIGHDMVDHIKTLPRLPDIDLSDDLMRERFNLIRAAV
jgi:hypothetical protein